MPFYEYECKDHGHSIVSAPFTESDALRACLIKDCLKPLKRLYSSYTFSFKF